MSSVLGLCLGIVFLVACQKEEVVRNNETYTNYSAMATRSSPWMDKIWEPDEENGDHQCPPGGDRCGSITFLTVSEEAELQDVLAAIDSNDSERVREVFEAVQSKGELGSHFDPDHIDAVIEGIMSINYVENNSRQVFLLFGDEPDAVYEYSIQ